MSRAILSLCVDNPSMRKLMEVIGGPLRPSENRTTWLYRVSDTIGIHYRVARKVWYDEPISQEIALRIKQAAKRHHEINQRTAERLEWNAAVLLEIDPDFYREESANYRELAALIRNLNREDG